MEYAESNIKDAQDRLDDMKDLKASLEKTHEELTNSKTHSGDKLKALEDNLTNLENDLNGNKQKIEDANGIIKRQTEQLLEQATDLQDFKVFIHGEYFPEKSLDTKNFHFYLA